MPPAPLLRPAAPAPASWKVTAAAVVGNTLEFYDFIIYSLFAAHIGRHFFPIESEFGSLLASVATYGLGFFARPLGGLVVGLYADTSGRRAGLTLTVALMTLGTLGIALAPGHAEIGLLAPALLVVCRLLQGFALGGEIGPATALLIEASPERSRGLWTSWQLASQGLAIGVGGAVGFAVTALISPEQVALWGWRVPFVVGLALVPVGAVLRKQLPRRWDCGFHGDYLDRLKMLFRQHRRLLSLGFAAMICAVVSTQLVQFMATYAIRQQLVSPALGQAAILVAGMATVAGALLGGTLCDRLGRQRAMFAPCAMLLFSAVPLFWSMTTLRGPTMLYAATAVIAGLTAAYAAACLVSVPELLPVEHRATGISIVYGCGLAVFGASSQALFVWLEKVLDDPLAPAYYVTAAAGVSLLAIRTLPASQLPRAGSPA